MGVRCEQCGISEATVFEPVSDGSKTWEMPLCPQCAATRCDGTPGTVCDVCGRQPATVHLTFIIEGQTSRSDLCEACALDAGWVDPSQLRRSP